MSTIQRYDLDMEDRPTMEEDSTGAYVLYTDHCAALAAVDKERDEALAVLREIAGLSISDQGDCRYIANTLLARHAPKEARE